MGGGQIAIVQEPEPVCPEGGLLVRTEASGLCSGELMDWYMDRKIPHVLGHEVAGIVVESQDGRFPVGARVAPHHHAPCMTCDLCQRGAYVHCEQWKRTKLVPGGMAEYFAVSAENLTDCHATEMRAIDASLAEPLACVVKSIRKAGTQPPEDGEPRNRLAVVGLGVMGLLHMLALPRWPGSSEWHVQYSKDMREELRSSWIGYELNPARREWATRLGLEARPPAQSELADTIFVCPGTQQAIRFALEIAAPGATICLFSPIGPDANYALPIDELYFRDLDIVTSYSCGPDEFSYALRILGEERIRAEQVVSHFISIDELPDAYQGMKRGEILKPMVLFS